MWQSYFKNPFEKIETWGFNRAYTVGKKSQLCMRAQQQVEAGDLPLQNMKNIYLKFTSSSVLKYDTGYPSIACDFHFDYGNDNINN